MFDVDEHTRGWVCACKGYRERVRRTCSVFMRVTRQSSAWPRLQYNKKETSIQNWIMTGADRARILLKKIEPAN
jgi:hypothetical protein